ncbi:MAG: hypothetical protein ACXVDD_04290, partial [Polyangia bacterium]
MRKLFPVIVAVAVLLACGWYALRVKAAAPPLRPPAVTQPQVDPPHKEMAVVNGRPAGMLPYVPAPLFDPHKKHKPGEYVPRGFSANYREQIIKDFGESIDARLGKDFPADKRKAMADVQNAFWDDHGPDVDLFKDGKISQPEFAERTHLSTNRFMEGMAKQLTDEQYLKLFDLPKDVDAFYQLYHSPEEQPGMPMQAQNSRQNNSVL